MALRRAGHEGCAPEPGLGRGRGGRGPRRARGPARGPNHDQLARPPRQPPRGWRPRHAARGPGSDADFGGPEPRGGIHVRREAGLRGVPPHRQGRSSRRLDPDRGGRRGAHLHLQAPRDVCRLRHPPRGAATHGRRGGALRDRVDTARVPQGAPRGHPVRTQLAGPLRRLPGDARGASAGNAAPRGHVAEAPVARPGPRHGLRRTHSVPGERGCGAGEAVVALTHAHDTASLGARSARPRRLCGPQGQARTEPRVA